MREPEALRLADAIDPNGTCLNNWRDLQDAAAELRRLHADTEYMVELVKKLVAQRDALLEALKLARSIIGHPDDAHSQFIDAAIAKAEGEKT